MAVRRRRHERLHAREEAMPARVSAGKALTEGVEVRLGRESAEARSAVVKAVSDGACRS
jgi:hypothetical protein